MKTARPGFWRRGSAPLALVVALYLGAAGARGQAAPQLAFTVTPQPEAHNFHVVFRCSGGNGETEDFSMPAWMPGYYELTHYARRVSHFDAHDSRGRRLGWERVTENSWRVVAGHAPVVEVSYDVAPTRPFAANNSMDNDQAFIAPPGMFLYIAGELARPVEVTVALPAAWHNIATGLAPALGQPHTFTATNFDVLFDSPWLLGNQETLEFRVGGVEHTIAMEYIPASVNRAKMVSDLRRIVTAATQLMGVMPYRRYTFLLVGRGNGGIEHLNSQASYFNGQSLTTSAGYTGWLSYVAHEYFHNFNVKRIRPLALGPFHYEQENLTDMLWVSEGLTVYYEDLLLVRAGLISPSDYLQTLQKAINTFENEPGRPYESATESSLHTWDSVYGGRGNRNVTISYYDNGAMLGAMLDLAIRHDSHNAHSLDDVMRDLYRTYYVKDQRGFTDAEFRAACEREAGQPLAEVFDYAASTRPVDYAKYLGYAGVGVSATAQPAPGTTVGLDTDMAETPLAAPPPPTPNRFRGPAVTPAARLLVSGVAAGSPAVAAGLRAGDQLLTLNGQPATSLSLSAVLASAHPGDTITIAYERGGGLRQAQATVTAKEKRAYSLRALTDSDALQRAIFQQWLRPYATAAHP
ncbi:MAG: M61 family metallopeptidase [Terriglobales bacterium]